MKDIEIQVLQTIKKTLKDQVVIDSGQINVNKYSDLEIGKTITRLYKSQYLRGFDYTSIGDQYGHYTIEDLTTSGEEYLKSLIKEYEKTTILGWAKNNWFPLVTLLVTTLINIFFR